jgi:hypothetical protein
VNPYDVKEIKQAIFKINEFEIRKAKFNQYINERKPTTFAENVINSIMDDI